MLPRQLAFENMAPSTKIFSLEGKGLKLDTAVDVDAHIQPLRAMEDVEEIRFLGNTLGVEACKVLGEVLETKKTLQVRLPSVGLVFLFCRLPHTNCAPYLGRQPG